MPLTLPKRIGRTTTGATVKLIPASDALKVCRAAAKLAMQGETYSYDDREDCAMDLLSLILERAKLEAENIDPEWLPANLCGIDFLTRRALNVRRKMEGENGRTERAKEDARSGFYVVDTPDELRGSWQSAATAANRMLRSAGVPATGDAWTAAYASARANAGLESREIAEELGMSFAAYRKGLSRGARKLSERGSMEDWSWALGTLDAGGSEHPSTDDLPESERIAPGHRVPNVKGSTLPLGDITPKRTRTRTRDSLAAWARPTVSSAWPMHRVVIDPLPPRTRARLDKAARMRRARATASDAATLRTERDRAGLAV